MNRIDLITNQRQFLTKQQWLCITSCNTLMIFKNKLQTGWAEIFGEILETVKFNPNLTYCYKKIKYKRPF